MPLAIVVALLPAASIIALLIWTQRASRRIAAPSWAILLGYGFVMAGALHIGGAAAWVTRAIVGAEGVDTTAKAQLLGEGFYAALDVAGAALPIAAMGALWLVFCTWRWARTSDPRT